jgi:glucosamine kinase
MSRPALRSWYSIDAGGSRTLATAFLPGRGSKSWSRESFAIASVGSARSQSVLETLLRDIREWSGTGIDVGCIASSSMPVADEAPPPSRLLEVIAQHAPQGLVVLVNDVVPLLWSSPLGGVGVVICSGTGSCVLGRDAESGMIKVGGHEHIVSDQGSAYSIARAALRAAAYDADGIGACTALRGEAETHFARPMPALGRWLAEMSRARATVASFAPMVIECARNGDEVAISIVESEAVALVDMVQVVVPTSAVAEMPTIGLAGGVLHGSEYYRKRVESALAARGLTDADHSNVTLIEGIAAGAQFAQRLADSLDDVSRLPDGTVIHVEAQPGTTEVNKHREVPRDLG